MTVDVLVTISSTYTTPSVEFLLLQLLKLIFVIVVSYKQLFRLSFMLKYCINTLLLKQWLWYSFFISLHIFLPIIICIKLRRITPSTPLTLSTHSPSLLLKSFFIFIELFSRFIYKTDPIIFGSHKTSKNVEFDELSQHLQSLDAVFKSCKALLLIAMSRQ